MTRILHLFPLQAPQSVLRQVQTLASRLGEGFQTVFHRENNLLGMIRRIRQDSYDQVHAWGMLPLLSAAMSFKGALHFTPLDNITPRQLRLLKAISSYRPFNAAMPSGLMADLWVGAGFSDKTVRMIPPGIDFSTCKRNRDDALRESCGLTPEHIAVASIAPDGHRDALWAASILHQLDPRWVFLHPAEPGDSLVEFANKIGGRSVLHLAPRSTPLDDLLSASDLILSTSRDFCPVHPIVHSMAMGLPIVGWATRCNSEYLEHRSNALLVNPGAIADLARRMLEMRENASLQWKLADQARRTAYERCSLSKNIQGFKDLYKTAAGAIAS